MTLNTLRRYFQTMTPSHRGGETRSGLQPEKKISHVHRATRNFFKNGADMSRIRNIVIVFLLAALTAGLAQEDPAALKEQIAELESQIEQMKSFEATRINWTRKADVGSIIGTFEVTLINEFDGSSTQPPLVTPQAGDLLVYNNTGPGSHRDRPPGQQNTTQSGQVVVHNARTHELVAYNELAPELRGSIHTTTLSPDGKYLYIQGPHVPGQEGSMLSGGSLIKVDALTLEPLKVMDVGGLVHHGQIFNDRYILFDTFGRGTGGLDVFLFDPETDNIVGGVRDEDLGGSTYVSFAGPEGKYIYILMEPSIYDNPVYTGYRAASQFRTGDLRWIEPYWVTQIDAETWEVVREYPYPAYRSSWIEFSADGQFMYVAGGGDDKLVKIDLHTGVPEWSSATGQGPYGIELTVDDSEVWVADKGETLGMFGRTISVYDNKTGLQLKTIPSGYQIDHILLSPDGNQIWAASNGDGRVYVYDTTTHEEAAAIDMPGFGSPHGMVFVHYDDNGVGRVVRDQGGFHGGVDPRHGQPLD